MYIKLCDLERDLEFGDVIFHAPNRYWMLTNNGLVCVLDRTGLMFSHQVESLDYLRGLTDLYFVGSVENINKEDEPQKFYSMGDVVELSSVTSPCLIAQVGSGQIKLIDITGNRFSDHVVVVGSVLRITHEELSRCSEGHKVIRRIGKLNKVLTKE